MSPSAAGAFCGDGRHDLCFGITQNAEGQWVACGCRTSGCMCATVQARGLASSESTS